MNLVDDSRGCDMHPQIDVKPECEMELIEIAQTANCRELRLHSTLLLLLVAVGSCWGITVWRQQLQYTPEAVMTFRQAKQCISGSIPAVGLKNSQGFYNPNALPLTIAPLLAISEHIEDAPLIVGVASVILLLYSAASAASAGPSQFALLGTACALPWTILTPLGLHTCCDIWGQHVARTLLCVYIGTAARIFVSPGNWFVDSVGYFLLGFLTLWLPAVHLAMAAVVPTLGVVSLSLLRRRQFKWSTLVPAALGVAAAFWLTWYPWITNLPGESRIEATDSRSGIDVENFLNGFGLREMGIAVRAFHEGANIEAAVPFHTSPYFSRELRISGHLRFLILGIASAVVLQTVYRHTRKLYAPFAAAVVVALPFSICTLLGFRSRLDYFIQFVTPLLILVVPAACSITLSCIAEQYQSSGRSRHQHLIFVLILSFSATVSILQLYLAHRIALKYRYESATNFPSIDESVKCITRISNTFKGPVVVGFDTSVDRFRWLDDMYASDETGIYNRYGLLQEILTRRAKCTFVESPVTADDLDLLIVISSAPNPSPVPGMHVTLRTENMSVYQKMPEGD
jgi:hypothetical protein